MTPPRLAGGVLDLVLVAAGLAAAAALLARRSVVAFVLRQAGNAAVARDHGSAVVWLRAARALGDRDPGLLVERAWHLARLGRLEDALGTYRRAARALPRVVGDAEYGAAHVLAEMGEADAAEEMLARAVARDPTVLHDLRHDEDLARLLGGRPRFDAWRRS